MVYANAFMNNPLDQSPKWLKLRHKSLPIDLLLAPDQRAVAANANQKLYELAPTKALVLCGPEHHNKHKN